MLRCFFPVIPLVTVFGLQLPVPAKAAAADLTPGEHTTAIAPREIFKRSISDVSGDIFLLAQPYNSLLDEGEFAPATFRASHLSTKHDGKVDLVVPPHPISMHGFAWDYDLRIPLAFYDPSGQWFKAKDGGYAEVAVQQDIAPTLAEILGIAAPDRSEGRILSEALVPAKADKARVQPKVIAVVVQDQMGLQYFAAHPGRARFIRKMIAASAFYNNAQVAHVDVETAVGHAAVATGGYARSHGITANTYWHPGLWGAKPVFSAQLTETMASEAFPLLYNAATLADVWTHERSNRPSVLAMVAAARASVALGGHGSMFKGGKKTAVAYLAEHGAKAGQYSTDENFFHLPEAMRGVSVRPYAEAFVKEKGGSWFGNRLFKDDGSMNLAVIRSSPALVRFESDLLSKSLKELRIGRQTDTDLVLVNFKSSDYCGHLFGYESEECGEVLEAIDHAVARLVGELKEAAGDQLVVAYTADHGAAPIPELSGGVRYDRQKLLDALRAKFDKGDKAAPTGFAFIGSSQLWLNRAVLKRNGVSISDVTTFLKTFEVPMAAPWNMLAEDWIKRGRPASQPFFYDVVSSDELAAAAK